ncbi:MULTISPECIES: hypothetical protein [unclassified Bradyrhizobium]|uniref:hypothetical protein n=1 Tax=unclassified Bradyrhizobium TaxID=2631580 RepID=UPI0024797743|nr:MULTISPECIES: hypothetical protein [unclassified Bradyrhizobium]WGR70256.1 hypothetical protein MTX24_33470 [Bradyrhizobium sp. ISRA426]WGR82315.1 hypothetical protein MTX21_18575 [Bradyrhizobium sp. ISRA430]WGR85500.1 hypothetical protein MTX25_33150 [Bradyrhizobium sp. ISRA432]
MATPSSSSMSINKLYGDNILSAAEYSSPLTISGTATVSNTSDAYAVEVIVKNQSGAIVDTLRVYNHGWFAGSFLLPIPCQANPSSRVRRRRWLCGTSHHRALSWRGQSASWHRLLGARPRLH